MPPLRTVYVVNDDKVACRSLDRLLQSHGFTTTTYQNAATFLSDAPHLTAGCVLLDARMPTMNSVEVMDRLLTNGFSHPVIVMAGAADIKTAVAAMKVGATDILEKPFGDQTLFDSVERCFASTEPARLNAERRQAANRIAALTRRELQVLEGLMNGSANKVIAFELGISVRTVEVHRVRMMERLGVKQLGEAVRIAVTAQHRRPRRYV